MSPAKDAPQQLTVDGHALVVRRLDKVLYPETGTTKADIIDYYVQVSHTLLPHLAHRPVTRLRWPNGVDAAPFFEKNLPAHSPDWLATVVLDSPSSRHESQAVRYPLIVDTAGLVWLANLAALELHVPQWTVGPRGGQHPPNRLVIDLDPGAPAGLDECAELALLVRQRLADDGLDSVPVTSGSKGLQLYAGLSGTDKAEAVREYTKKLAESLERERPELVVSRMTKTLRPGKVLLDWSQNTAAKTTISPYSLRGRTHPNAAAPRSWDELQQPGLKQLSYRDVLTRLAKQGDLAAPLLEHDQRLPTS